MKKKLYDNLNFERKVKGGGQFFKGTRGRYVFQPGEDGRPAHVIRDRRYFTGLFPTVFKDSKFQYTGSNRDEGLFLCFKRMGRDFAVYSLVPRGTHTERPGRTQTAG